jgi:membrane-associated phospholipid phosphatase
MQPRDGGPKERGIRGRGVAVTLGLAAALLLKSVPVPAVQLDRSPPAAATLPVSAPVEVSGDAVIFWNGQTNRAIQATSTDPFRASRALALESIAVFDTVRSIAGAPSFLIQLPGPRDAAPGAVTGVSTGAAVAGAAHKILSRLFPTLRSELDLALTANLANEPSGPARDRAMAIGEAVAEAVYAARDQDGWNVSAPMRMGTGPGEWRPTPPRFLPPLDPQWSTLTPFVLTRPEQFRPAVPPAPGSAALHEAAAYVASIGGVHSSVRTEEQSVIARYWSDAIGTYAPAGHWNAITARLMAPLGLGIDAEAELFAQLNVAIADSAIAIADAKYTYWYWRPVTVIRDGAAGLPPMPNWFPLLETPNHPSYISGHSGFSGAAAAVLTARFGTRPFDFASDSLPGVSRRFTSFQQAAEEAAFSRVLGGIHYPFDNAAGLATGRAVGAWTLTAFRRIAQDRGPVIVMDRPEADGIGRGPSGYALDNVSPVTMVTIRLDGGAPFRVGVDQRGRFLVPRQGLELTGRRVVLVKATSVTGRTTTMTTEIGTAADSAVTAPLTVQ